MSYSGRAQAGSSGAPGVNNEQPGNCEPGNQGGQYAGGYTVFQPNERKRQEVNHSAQRGLQAFEEYKQSKSNVGRTYHHRGSVGGGEMTEDQARKKQAQEVRAQKVKRQMQQEERRQAKRRAEEKEIEQMRAEARRKAEQNAARDALRQAPPEELRRKREAFLQSLERKK